MNTKKLINEFKLTIDSKSVNEAFARVAVSAFVTPLDPTLEEIADLLIRIHTEKYLYQENFLTTIQ